MKHSEEDRLVRQCLAGDKDAFDALVRRYAPKVSSVVGTLVGHTADLEDLVQETFL